MSIFSISLNQITGSSLKSGDFLFIKILKKIDDRNFIIKIGNTKQTIQSRIPLLKGKEYRVRYVVKEGKSYLKILPDKTLPGELLQKNLSDEKIKTGAKISPRIPWDKIIEEKDDRISEALEQRLFHEDYYAEWKPLEKEKNQRWFKEDKDYWLLQPLLVIKDRKEHRGWLRLFLSGDKNTFKIFLHLENDDQLWEFTLIKNKDSTQLSAAVNNEKWVDHPPESWLQWAQHWKNLNINVNLSLKLLRNQGGKSENKREGFSFITDITV